jgi:hypothetical protein
MHACSAGCEDAIHNAHADGTTSSCKGFQNAHASTVDTVTRVASIWHDGARSCEIAAPRLRASQSKRTQGVHCSESKLQRWSRWESTCCGVMRLCSRRSSDVCTQVSLAC